MRAQFLERIKFLFIAYLVQKLDFDAIAVDIPIEIENVDFKDGIDTVNGRAGADTGHASQRLIIYSFHLNRKYSFNDQGFIPHLDINSGITELAPEFLSVCDST